MKKGIIRFIFNFILLAVILFLVVNVLKKVDFHEVFNLLDNISLFWFVMAFLVCGIDFLIWNLRGQIVSSTFVKTNYWYFLLTSMSGFFVNTITPGAGTGGEPIKAYYL